MLTRREMIALSAADRSRKFAAITRLGTRRRNRSHPRVHRRQETNRRSPRRTANAQRLHSRSRRRKRKKRGKPGGQQLREQLLVANGLWPMPEKTPLNAVVHGKIERDGYTIEKVYFASMPGHYVTGNLYRPKAVPSQEAPRRAVRARALGERPLPRRRREGREGERRCDGRTGHGSRPVLHAGVAGDTRQARVRRLPVRHGRLRRQHRDPAPRGLQGRRRLNCGSRARWGFRRGTASALSISSTSLPDVDAEADRHDRGQRRRHANVHARSDRRPHGACVPGGDGQHRNAGRVRVRELLAAAGGHGQRRDRRVVRPEAAGHERANDWTKEMMTKGYPELQQLYELYGAKDKVAATCMARIRAPVQRSRSRDDVRLVPEASPGQGRSR